ncbi:MAG TPA: transporter substrate-binding domain-containing protein [Hyphomicrobiaceae bacterium]|nr:transporter substrate-binding domain-containing protein [Hyphomicrobiaceae bacterium]
MTSRRALHLTLWAIAVLAMIAGSFASRPTIAQESSADSGRRAVIRFLTDTDYPPFHYVDQDGTLTGFNVEIARAICRELEATCDVQAKEWGELLGALKRGEANAVIASMAASPKLLRDFDVTDPYYYTPARFAAKSSLALQEVTPETIEGKRVAVVRGSAHEAFLRAFFTRTGIVAFDNPERARDALITGETDLLFDDAISLSFWLLGTSSKACCDFKGGAFLEPMFFGEGVGVVINKNQPDLKRQINAALQRLKASGRYDEITSKSFPLKTN